MSEAMILCVPDSGDITHFPTSNSGYMLPKQMFVINHSPTMLYILQSCRHMKTYFLIVNIIQILQSNIMLVVYSCL